MIGGIGVRSAIDKDRSGTMSSMRRLAFLFVLVAAPSGSVIAQSPYATAYPAPAVSQTDINYALADWRRLRASDGYAFADYARFIIANPEWPDDNRLRAVAEKQMRSGDRKSVV